MPCTFHVYGAWNDGATYELYQLPCKGPSLPFPFPPGMSEERSGWSHECCLGNQTESKVSMVKYTVHQVVAQYWFMYERSIASFPACLKNQRKGNEAVRWPADSPLQLTKPFLVGFNSGYLSWFRRRLERSWFNDLAFAIPTNSKKRWNQIKFVVFSEVQTEGVVT